VGGVAACVLCLNIGGVGGTSKGGSRGSGFEMPPKLFCPGRGRDWGCKGIATISERGDFGCRRRERIETYSKRKNSSGKKKWDNDNDQGGGKKVDRSQTLTETKGKRGSRENQRSSVQKIAGNSYEQELGKDIESRSISP